MAVRAGEFLFREMVVDGRVMRSYRPSRPFIPGFLEDYGALGLAALALYELTFDPSWLERATLMTRSLNDWFWSEESQTLYDTAHDHERLITRPRDVTDNAVPSGTSLALDLMLRVAEVMGDETLRGRAHTVLGSLAEPMAQHGAAFGYLLGVADMAIHGAVEVALVGDPQSDDFAALAREVANQYLPSLVLAGGPPERTSSIPLLASRRMRESGATAYVCRDHTCEEPTTDPKTVRVQLQSAVRRR